MRGSAHLSQPSCVQSPCSWVRAHLYSPSASGPRHLYVHTDVANLQTTNSNNLRRIARRVGVRKRQTQSGQAPQTTGPHQTSPGNTAHARGKKGQSPHTRHLTLKPYRAATRRRPYAAGLGVMLRHRRHSFGDGSPSLGCCIGGESPRWSPPSHFFLSLQDAGFVLYVRVVCVCVDSVCAGRRRRGRAPRAGQRLIASVGSSRLEKGTGGWAALVWGRFLCSISQYLPAPLRISPHLPASPCICPYLPPYLPVSARISYLPASPGISRYLPVSRHIPPYPAADTSKRFRPHQGYGRSARG